MSFLSALQSRKTKLKPTTTTVTYPDGSQRTIKCTSDAGVQELGSTVMRQYGFVVDTKPDTVPACILDEFLYLGSQDAVIDANIEQYTLTDILSIGIEAPPFDQNPNRFVNVHFLPCLDLPDTKLDHFVDKAIDIINVVRNEQPNGRVLVHCNAGVSRSATVCIAYLIKEEGMSFEEALGHVKSKRECIRPNDGFMKQLKVLAMAAGAQDKEAGVKS